MIKEKPVSADKINEKRDRSGLEQEKKFVSIMRQQIYKLTDYDVEPNDSIYPLLACLQKLSEGTAYVLREHDRKEWRKIEENIQKTLTRYYGSGRPDRIRLFLFGGSCLLGGLIIGIALGLFFRIMAS